MATALSSLIKQLPLKGSLLTPEHESFLAYCGDVVLRGTPDAVVRARDIQDISEVMAYCHGHKIPVTFIGGQTGLTGASAALSGIVIVTEAFDRLLDVGQTQSGQAYAVAEPGIYLGELKSQVSQEGFFYPPDPTSYQEARLGGTIATNATGEDTLLYGPTRAYVRALKVVMASGEIKELVRPEHDQPPLSKGGAGYVMRDQEIDLLIGSEGTLAYIAEARLDLLPEPKNHWAALGFFKSLEEALDFLEAVLSSDQVEARALELMDAAALEFFRQAAGVPPLPVGTQAALYWKQECDEPQMEASLEAWHQFFSGLDIWVAQTRKQQQEFRQWRHHIPAMINETVSQYREQGGGKVAGDWWVPPQAVRAALQAVYQQTITGLEPIVFGHIGNGHPHVNYLAKDAQQKQQGLALLEEQCRRAVNWGGGVAGEHGVGKIHRHFLQLQHPERVIAKMQAVKRQWDPHWILGQGTLFDVPPEFVK